MTLAPRPLAAQAPIPHPAPGTRGSYLPESTADQIIPGHSENPTVPTFQPRAHLTSLFKPNSREEVIICPQFTFPGKLSGNFGLSINKTTFPFK